MDIDKLREQHVDVTMRARAIQDEADTAQRELSADEAAKFEDLIVRAEQVAARIVREEALRGHEDGSRASFRAPTKPQPEASGVTGERITMTGEPKRFRSMGEQLQAIVRSSRPGGTVDPRLLEQQRAATGLNETLGGDGGFLVQQDFTEGLVKRTYELGTIASRVRKVPVGANKNGTKMPAVDESSRANGSRWGGVASYWGSEGGTLTASRPKFRQISLEFNKLYALVYATDELVEDAAALQSYVEMAASEELAFRLDDAILNGTGVGQPLGILNSGGLLTISKETGQPAATFVAENVSKMWARAFGPSRRNAVWLYNQDMEPQLDQLSLPIGTAGVPVYLPIGAGLVEASTPRLKGRPMLDVEQASTLGTVGDIVLANLDEYLLIERPPQTAMSIHVAFLTDEVVFRFTYRVDGQPVWHTTLTPKNGSNTQSAFVALETRS